MEWLKDATYALEKEVSIFNKEFNDYFLTYNRSLVF